MTGSRRLFPLTLATALAFDLVGCGNHFQTTENPHVLIITLDTARQDRFSYAGSHVATPAVDSLARNGVAFMQAITTAPITLPAHTSLFTGLLPTNHGVRDNAIFRVPDNLTTLAEVLSDAGYLTAAFIGASVLEKRYGLAQGFQFYDQHMGKRNSDDELSPRRDGSEVVESALEWAKSSHGPSFVWVHLFDPHAPYRPPEPEKSTYASSYDAMVAYTDRVVGTLLSGYEELGILESCIVVLAADHGESLGEHGENTHGILVYDATVRVPLIIKLPRGMRGLKVTEQVSLIDVYPTILSQLAIRLPGDVDGVDLSPALRGEPVLDLPEVRYIETLLPRFHYGWSGYRSVRSSSAKLIQGVRPELFNLVDDPGEIQDVYSHHTEVGVHLERILKTHLDADSTAGEMLGLDASTRDKLESLGYVWSQPGRSTTDQTLVDPKDRLYEVRLIETAQFLLDSGEVDRAVAALNELLRLNPMNSFAVRKLADSLYAEGKIAEAVARYKDACDLLPGDQRMWAMMGACLERLGKEDEALDSYQRACSFGHGYYDEVRTLRWSLLIRRGRAGEVIRETEEEQANTPSDSRSFAALALARRISGQPIPTERIQQFIRDHEVEADSGELLAKVLELQGDHTTALEAYSRALEKDPRRSSARLALVNLALSQGDFIVAETAAQGLDPTVLDEALQKLISQLRILINRQQTREAAETLLTSSLPPIVGGSTSESQATEIAKKQAASLSSIGGVFWQAELFVASTRAYSLASERAPWDHRLQFNIGLLAEKQGDKKMAETAYENALSLSPSYAQAQARLAALYTNK